MTYQIRGVSVLRSLESLADLLRSRTWLRDDRLCEGLVHSSASFADVRVPREGALAVQRELRTVSRIAQRRPAACDSSMRVQTRLVDATDLAVDVVGGALLR